MTPDFRLPGISPMKSPDQQARQRGEDLLPAAYTELRRMAAGLGEVGTDNLEPFLRRVADRCQRTGHVLRVRVRVPADAPVRHFVYLTRCMERAGIPGLRIAVVRPGAPWI